MCVHIHIISLLLLLRGPRGSDTPGTMSTSSALLLVSRHHTVGGRGANSRLEAGKVQDEPGIPFHTRNEGNAQNDGNLLKDIKARLMNLHWLNLRQSENPNK